MVTGTMSHECVSLRRPSGEALRREGEPARKQGLWELAELFYTDQPDSGSREPAFAAGVSVCLAASMVPLQAGV